MRKGFNLKSPKAEVSPIRLIITKGRYDVQQLLKSQQTLIALNKNQEILKP